MLRLSVAVDAVHCITQYPGIRSESVNWILGYAQILGCALDGIYCHNIWDTLEERQLDIIYKSVAVDAVDTLGERQLERNQPPPGGLLFTKVPHQEP